MKIRPFIYAQTMTFSTQISDWYTKNKRPLPWRETTDPYKIWLSEIILQQTRVDQGTAYYLKFVNHYPTVQDLANADEDSVLKDWQGLGYYSRARNLHFSAKYVVNECDGKFPENYADLLKLKGVGKYTAAAIASICFGEAVAVVDGNVYRVMTRIFGIDTPIDSTEGAKQIEALANELIDRKDPSTFNQAVMEFGALQCTPKTPDCMFCPFQDKCEAFNQNKVHELPVKAKKTKVRERHFNYLVLRHNQHLYIRKRTGKGIWQNLHDFPLVETEKPIKSEQLFANEAFQGITGGASPKLKRTSETFKHVLSHQVIKAVFWELSIEKKLEEKHAFKFIPTEEFEDYAIPRLIENYARSTDEFYQS